jgi:MtrB/PioB family decaheme-associated outer membrane protein
MNSNRTLKVVVAALLGAGAAGGQPALAQQPNFDEWPCKFCPFPDKGPEGSVGVSALHVSEDSARFGDYTGLDEKGAYGNADAELMYRGETGYAIEVDGRNLGLDARSLELRAGRQGSWVVDLSWDELPRHKDDSVRTVYDGLGGSSLTLPNAWVRGNFTSDFSALDASLRDFSLGWDRKTGGLGFEFVQSERLRYEVDWSQQTKEGSGLTWGSFLGTAEELVKPLDYQTDQVDAGIVYSGARWNMRLGYYGSFFSNQDTALRWENPFNGPELGRAAMAPDNRHQQFTLSGAYQFQTWGTTLNASYAQGRMEQSDALLAYTINPAIAAQPLPREAFDGRADTTHANLRLTSSPSDKLRLSAEYRYNERDNQSGQYEWAIVQADSFQSFSFENPVYSFENRDLGLTANYAFSRMLQGSAGWQQKVREREFQNVDRTEEDSVWARFRFRPFDALTLSLKGESAERDASEYRAIPGTGAGAEQNPLLRKYYLADRDRELVQVQADIVPGARGTVSFRYETARDDYKQSPVGLVSSDYDQFSADASLQFWKALVASAYFSRETYDSVQLGAGSFSVPNTAPPNWQGRSEDQHDVHGIALSWPGLADGKLDLRADWTRADTSGDIGIANSLAATANPFPTLRSKLTGTQLVADWHLSERWSLNAGWRWEKYSADDWAIDGVGPATIGNVLTFGAQTLDYDVNVFLLGFRYRFIQVKAD